MTEGGVPILAHTKRDPKNLIEMKNSAFQGSFSGSLFCDHGLGLRTIIIKSAKYDLTVEVPMLDDQVINSNFVLTSNPLFNR